MGCLLGAKEKNGFSSKISFPPFLLPFIFLPPFSPWPRRRREGGERGRRRPLHGSPFSPRLSAPKGTLWEAAAAEQRPTERPTVPAGKVAAALPSPFFFPHGRME